MPTRRAPEDILTRRGATVSRRPNAVPALTPARDVRICLGDMFYGVSHDGRSNDTEPRGR